MRCQVCFNCFYEEKRNIDTKEMWQGWKSNRHNANLIWIFWTVPFMRNAQNKKKWINNHFSKNKI